MKTKASSANLVARLYQPAGEIRWPYWGMWAFLWACFSLFVPRDASYDIAHYQIHNGWAVVNGRSTIDLAPAEMHSFLNPAWQAFIWLLIDNLPGRLVVFCLAVLQALTLPALYTLTRRGLLRVSANPSLLVAMLIALLGYFSAFQFIFISSLLNDSLSACVYLAALILLMPRTAALPCKRALFLASFLLGSVLGLKLTNLSYAIGFAVFVLILLPNWKLRAQGTLICTLGGALGFLLLGGPSAWWLWQSYGNPIFPYFNHLFDAPLGPDTAFRDPRYLPDSWLHGLYRPFEFLTDGMIINEYDFFDPRFQLTYIACGVGLIISIFRPAGRTDEAQRFIVALATGLISTILVWTYLFSIARYIFAVWLLAPTVCAIILAYWAPHSMQSRGAVNALLGLSIVSSFTTQAPDLRRVEWGEWQERYVELDLSNPERFSGALIAFSGGGPSAFLAPYFPSDAVFTHLLPQSWSAPALQNYRGRIRDEIQAARRPLYIVTLDSGDLFKTTILELRQIESVLVQPATCEKLVTNFDNGSAHWVICPAKYVGDRGVR